MKGIDVVVHLAGIPDEDSWTRIRDLNIDGCHNVFEAARQSSVKRVVFASANHVVGFHRRDRMIDDTNGLATATWCSWRRAASTTLNMTSWSYTACPATCAIIGTTQTYDGSVLHRKTMETSGGSVKVGLRNPVGMCAYAKRHTHYGRWTRAVDRSNCIRAVDLDLASFVRGMHVHHPL